MKITLICLMLIASSAFANADHHENADNIGYGWGSAYKYGSALLALEYGYGGYYGEYLYPQTPLHAQPTLPYLQPQTQPFSVCVSPEGQQYYC